MTDEKIFTDFKVLLKTLCIFVTMSGRAHLYLLHNQLRKKRFALSFIRNSPKLFKLKD